MYVDNTNIYYVGKIFDEVCLQLNKVTEYSPSQVCSYAS